jgi:ribose-phosphate pyrophosphokinase
VVGEKCRSCHDEKAEILQVIGEVEGKDAVIIDDFSISGMTLANLARALKRKGALSAVACLSHVPLSRAGVETIESSDLDGLVATDSVERDYVTGMSKLKLISVAPLFAEAVRRTQAGLSVSELFEGLCPSIIEASLGS